MIELTHGPYTARINPLGGGLAELRRDDRDLVTPQHGTSGTHRFRGAVLAPWSNRIGDGRYEFGGSEHVLPLNEPDRGNALHGLVLDAPWQPVDAATAAVFLRLRLGPEDGYPFRLDLALHYVVSDNGLAVSLDATNAGDLPAPYGCGFHPYLEPAAGRVDDVSLLLDADTRLLTDPLRNLPTGREPVRGTAYDFAEARRIGGLDLDDAFTGVRLDDSGVHRALAGDLAVWWKPSLRWVQVFTAEDRSAVAVEPCTAPPDAFRTGEDLVVLDPGATHRVEWGIAVRAGDDRVASTGL